MTEQPVRAVSDSNALKSYPIGFAAKKIPFRMGPLDADGIPMVKYKQYSEPVYFQVTIAQYGFANHQMFVQTGQKEYLNTFLRCADWHLETSIPDKKDRFGLYYLKGPLTYLNRKDLPWPSAMAQGHALSIASMAFRETGDIKYKNLADRVLPSMFYPVEEEGVFTFIDNDRDAIFYEEWAFYPAIHILNGCLFAIQGLFDYYSTFGGVVVGDWLKRAVKGVEKYLPLYDYGWWSKYSLGFTHNLASFHYQETHVEQLQKFGKLWQNDFLVSYGDRFAVQYASSINRFRREVYSNGHKLYRRTLLNLGMGEYVLTPECRREARLHKKSGSLID